MLWSNFGWALASTTSIQYLVFFFCTRRRSCIFFSLSYVYRPSPQSSHPPFTPFHPNLLNIHKATNSSVSRTPFTQNNKLSLLLATCKTLLIETHSQSRSNELEKEHNKITSSHTADQNSLGGCLSHR